MNRTVEPLAPYGAALKEAFAGNADATIHLRSSLGEDDKIPSTASPSRSGDST